MEKVTLFKKGSLDKWKVTVKNLESFKTSELVFDAVIVCNGLAEIVLKYYNSDVDGDF